MQALAERAVARFTHVDAWVNAAAVTTYGRLEDIPEEEVRRLVEVNVLGYVHGMREALRLFRRQHHGVIVNVASLLSELPVPLQAPYVLSKHAVVGLADAVRLELVGEKHVHVCSVLPGSIDTPIFSRAGNHTGRMIKAPNPSIRPEAVARAIVGCIRRPRRRRPVGISTRIALRQHALLPRTTERVLGRAVRFDDFRREPAPDSSGNVFGAGPDIDGVRGGWRGGVQGVVRRTAVAGAVGGAVVAIHRRAR